MGNGLRAYIVGIVLIREIVIVVDSEYILGFPDGGTLLLDHIAIDHDTDLLSRDVVANKLVELDNGKLLKLSIIHHLSHLRGQHSLNIIVTVR